MHQKYFDFITYVFFKLYRNIYNLTKLDLPNPYLASVQVSFSNQNLSIVCRRHCEYPWVKGFPVCSNDGPGPLSRGDDL